MEEGVQKPAVIIECVAAVGQRVYVFSGNRVQHLLVDRVETKSEKDSDGNIRTIIRYKLDGIKNLVDESQIGVDRTEFGERLLNLLS